MKNDVITALAKAFKLSDYVSHFEEVASDMSVAVFLPHLTLSESEKNKRVKAFLNTYEGCYHSLATREETRQLLLISLFTPIYETFNESHYLVINGVNNLIKEHKRLSIASMQALKKYSSASKKSLSVFPYSLLEDAKWMLIYEQQPHEQFEDFKQLFATFSNDFVNQRRIKFMDHNVSPEFIFFNFEKFLHSKKWNTSWARMKSFTLNWPKSYKVFIEHLRTTDDAYTKEATSKYTSTLL